MLVWTPLFRQKIRHSTCFYNCERLCCFFADAWLVWFESQVWMIENTGAQALGHGYRCPGSAATRRRPNTGAQLAFATELAQTSCPLLRNAANDIAIMSEVLCRSFSARKNVFPSEIFAPSAKSPPTEQCKKTCWNSEPKLRLMRVRLLGMRLHSRRCLREAKRPPR